MRTQLTTAEEWAELRRRTQNRASFDGSRQWASLHHFAWSYPETASADTQRAARAWLADWQRDIPRVAHCGCQSKWERLVSACPPPLSGRRDLYWWTVAMHDAVNRALGKPLWVPEWSLHHPALSVDLTLLTRL